MSFSENRSQSYSYLHYLSPSSTDSSFSGGLQATAPDIDNASSHGTERSEVGYKWASFKGRSVSLPPPPPLMSTSHQVFPSVQIDTRISVCALHTSNPPSLPRRRVPSPVRAFLTMYRVSSALSRIHGACTVPSSFPFPSLPFLL